MPKLDLSGGLALITDGSANYKDGSGGWAWVAIDALEGLQTEAGYKAGTTIGQMELFAPTRGLFHLHDEYGACEVLVYSDSEYVVRGVNDRTRKRNKNRHYWHRLDDAIERHTYVEFIHVRGHSDHHYNEMADHLAGEARRSKGAK